MTRPKVVTDASVLAKSGSIDDPHAAIVLQHLQRRYDVLAPAVAASELGNVAHRKDPDAFGADPRERSATLENLLEGITLVGSDADLRTTAGKRCTTHSLSFYDAEYLALAELTASSILLSDDRKLLEAGKDVLGVRRVMSLADAQSAIQRKLL